MTNLSEVVIAQACGTDIGRAKVHAPALNAAMEAYGITNPQQQAMFLAQIGHETGRLVFMVELWGPTPAQVRYEGRADLGNTQPGDGHLFRGRGMFQTTGRSNYATLTQRLRRKFPDKDVPNFEARPDLVANSEWAALAAADYWVQRGCGKYADIGDIEKVTRVINGGINGLEERKLLWSRALKAFGL